MFLSLFLSRLSNGSSHPRNGLIDFLIGAPRPVITTVEPLILSPRTWRKRARADVHASSIIRKLEITVHARPRCLTSFTLVRDERRSTTSLLSRLVTTMLVSDSERWARLDTDAPKQVDENRDIKDQKKNPSIPHGWLRDAYDKADRQRVIKELGISKAILRSLLETTRLIP